MDGSSIVRGILQRYPILSVTSTDSDPPALGTWLPSFQKLKKSVLHLQTKFSQSVENTP
jgi:hypothetical protein